MLQLTRDVILRLSLLDPILCVFLVCDVVHELFIGSLILLLLGSCVSVVCMCVCVPLNTMVEVTLYSWCTCDVIMQCVKVGIDQL